MIAQTAQLTVKYVVLIPFVKSVKVITTLTQFHQVKMNASQHAHQHIMLRH